MKIPKIVKSKQKIVLLLLLATAALAGGTTFYRHKVVRQKVNVIEAKMKEERVDFDKLATRSEKYKVLKTLKTKYDTYKDSGEEISQITAIYSSQMEWMASYFIQDYQTTLDRLTLVEDIETLDEDSLSRYVDQLELFKIQVKGEKEVIGNLEVSENYINQAEELIGLYQEKMTTIQVNRLKTITATKVRIMEKVDNFEKSKDHSAQLDIIKALIDDYSAYQEAEEIYDESTKLYEGCILDMQKDFKAYYEETITQNTLGQLETISDKPEISKAQANLETLLITIKDEEETVCCAEEVENYDSRIKGLTAQYEERLQEIVKIENEERRKKEAALQAGEATTNKEGTSDYLSDGTLFIGNSRTEFLAYYSGWTGTDFWYRGGITIWEIMDTPIVWDGSSKITVSQALNNNQYKHIYIMLGVNEWGTNTDQGFANEYQRVLAEIEAKQPNAKIYIESIVHVSGEKDSHWGNRANGAINRRNSLLKNLADGSRIFYIDFNEYLDDSTGALDARYTWDGVHFVVAMTDTWKTIVLSNIK